MAVYEIPVTPEPQVFQISLAGISYQVSVLWNTFSSLWTIDLLTPDGVKVLSGIPLVTGVDLFGQFAYLGLGGKLYCYTDHDLAAPPTFTNLGVTSHLTFETA